MASLQQRNYRFAGFAFFFASAIFFLTSNTAMGAVFLSLGAAFVAISTQRVDEGKKDGK